MKKESTSSGMGIGTILFLIFLILKLTETGIVANWSWWWVTAPLWIPLLIVLVYGLIYLIAIILKG